MSAESDVIHSVKLVSSKMKLQVKSNLTKAIQRNMLSVEQEKLPGICMIVEDAIDQAFNENAATIVNAVKAHTR